MKTKIVVIVVVVIILVVLLSFATLLMNQSQQIAQNAGQGLSSMNYGKMESASYLGYSVGGAKDIENFRENIENGYFPISTDVTYNGIFYDYMFDTGMLDENRTGDEPLFFPSYSTAISKDPVSSKNEYYLTVGLNSNIKEDFQRKKLNLLVLLDISGSMGSSFSSYYYDNPFANGGISESKMKLANKAVCTLIDQLKPDDCFGLVTFDSEAKTLQTIKQVSDLNLSNLKNNIMEITDRGGTNFSAGYIEATAAFKNFQNANKDEYENRIIIITDAMPNYGETGSNSLLKMVDNNATSGIYTTFIGVGVDFNTKLIEEITDVKGANYYSVHNNEEFQKRMGEEFEFMVTPLVFDLSLDVDSKDYSIEAIYGSDSANAKNGNIMKVNTLFPSKSEGGEVKGGVILLKVTPKGNKENGELKLTVSFKDRNNKSYKDEQSVSFKETEEEYYDNTGIRKAIVLVRYVNVLKNWILYERSNNKDFLILPVSGIIDGYKYDESFIILKLGEHERTSVPLSVSKEYKEIFTDLKSYIEKENEELKDDTFDKEYKVLDLLVEYDSSKPVENEKRFDY